MSNLSEGWYSRFEFSKGVAAISQFPPDTCKEVAIAGRSNVGKSSVINKITNRRSLARTSKTPGRTRELNYFSYDDETHIVDLPGYGFAKVDRAQQQAWSKLLDNYLQKRQSLQGLFLIMDIRHPLTAFDEQMLNYCNTCNLRTHILLNKADKVSRGAGLNTLAKIQKDLSDYQISLQLFSALKGTGVDEAREQLKTWLFSN